jgi:hypothetical protein
MASYAFHLRPARPEDVDVILHLIAGLVCDFEMFLKYFLMLMVSNLGSI